MQRRGRPFAMSASPWIPVGRDAFVRIVRAIVISAFVAVAICGCAIRPEAIPARVSLPTSPYGDIITTRAKGTLISKGSCLLLSAERAGRRFELLLIWPPGSRFNGVAVVPAIPKRAARAFSVGAEIEVGGNSPQWEQLPPYYPQLLPWRDRCRARPFFVTTIRPAD